MLWWHASNVEQLELLSGGVLDGGTYVECGLLVD